MPSSVLRRSGSWLLPLLIACAPDLPSAAGHPSPAPSDAPEPIPEGPSTEVVIEPPSPFDAVPTVARFRVQAAAPTVIDPTRLHLFEGELASQQLAYADDIELPQSLAGRLVPTLAWLEGDGATLAPTRRLLPGEPHTIVHGSERVLVVRTSMDDTLETWAHRWPPEGRSPSGTLGVWCGEGEPFAVHAPVVLEPSGLVGAFRSGVAPGESSRRCVHFEPAAILGPDEDRSLPPLRLLDADGERVASIEPIPMERGSVDEEALVPEPCASGFLPLGPGCVRIEDDRMLLEAPKTALLWSVQGPASPGVDFVFATDGGSRYLWPLPVAAELALTITTLDAAGGASPFACVVHTLPPRPHLVIDEVFANPFGPEPAQEWVELVNDGLVSASLVGMKLADLDGFAALPAVSLPPGGRALLVNDAYDASGKSDPPPAPGTLIVRLARLAKNGLKNSGEPLELLDATGAVVSRFPALPPKPGCSIYRVDPKSFDDFRMSVVGQSTPGAPNAPGP